MKACFLFSTGAEPGWRRRKTAAFYLWNGLWLLLAAVGLGLVVLPLAIGPAYATSILLGYFERPLILLLNLIPPVVLMALFFGLTRRPGCAFLLTGAVVIGFSAANYYMMAFRDDPLMFADLTHFKEALSMTSGGNYQLFVDWKIGLALVCLLGGWLFLHFFVRWRPKWKLRLSCVAAAVLAVFCLRGTYLSDSVYNVKTAYYVRLSSQWAATQQYLAHGFLYPFLHSIGTAFEQPPEGYDKREAAQLLESYEDSDIPEEEKVNVVAIMLEAYNDFTYFGVPDLAQDVYAPWHALAEEGYSGRLVTNIFAGGTIDTERTFLMGTPLMGEIRQRTNSYPWYFRSQGYKTEGMHPCYSWFYNRTNVNANLGFEDYWFVENYFTEFTGGGVALDDVFFPELLKTYQAATAGDQPYFHFSVTYQGHGPYNNDLCWWGEKGEFVVDDGTYTQEQQYILDNYFGSIADTNAHIKEFTDYLREDEEPVVLVLFGDHNPWMGDGNSVYTAMGIDFDLSSQQGFYNYYSTPYLIWANPAAQEVLGKDFRGEGPDMSPCFLMSKVFELCGWEGPAYMQAIAETVETLPVVHKSGRCVEEGLLTDQPRNAELLRQFRALEYYYRKNFIYE